MPITPNFPGAVGEPPVLIIEDYEFASNSTITTANYSMCVHVGASGFYRCSSLTTASFPECTNIDTYAFYSCSKLATVSFPKCTYIGRYAFQSCKSLTTIEFSACTFISQYGFYSCISLTTASFPKCGFISASAFTYCSALESLYLMNSYMTAIYNTGIFYYTPMSSSGYLGHYGSIYVPSSLVDSYKNNNNWSFYSNRIVGV